MGWFGSNSDSELENAYNNIPQTPGITAWALGSLPTILYGTPKLRQTSDNDEVYSNLTSQLQTINSSTPRKGGKGRRLFSTPVRTDPVAGILKTPGTVGKSKNVAFAGLNSTLSATGEGNDEPVETPVVSRTTKSGLPANFPGKFPSPFTPKSVDILNDDEHTPLTQLTNKNTLQNIDNVKHPPSTPLSSTSSSSTPLSAVDINKIINQTNKLDKSNKEISETTDKIFLLVDKMGKLDNAASDEWMEKVEIAKNYAKEKDDEANYYRLRLAQVMEESTELTKKYNEEIERRNDSVYADSRIKELERKLSEVERTNQANQELENKLSLLEKDYYKVINENDELLKTNNELRSTSSEVQELERQLNEKCKEIDRLRSQQQTNGSNEKLQNQINDLNLKLQLAESKISSLRSTNNRLTKQLETTSSSSTNNPSTSLLKDENKALHSQLDDLQLQNIHTVQQKDSIIQSLQNQISSLQREHVQQEAQQEDRDAHVQLLSKQLREKKIELEQLQKTYQLEHENTQQLLLLKSSNRQLLSQLESIQPEYSKLQQNYYTSEQERHRLTQEKELLSSKIRQLELGISTLGAAKPPLNPLSISKFGSSDNSSSFDSPKTTEHLPPVPKFTITIPNSLQQRRANISNNDFSMRDATMPPKDITMKDISTSSSNSSRIINDPARREASMLRLAQRKSRIRNENSSQMSISSN